MTVTVRYSCWVESTRCLVDENIKCVRIQARLRTSTAWGWRKINGWVQSNVAWMADLWHNAWWHAVYSARESKLQSCDGWKNFAGDAKACRNLQPQHDSATRRFRIQSVGAEWVAWKYKQPDDISQGSSGTQMPTLTPPRLHPALGISLGHRKSNPGCVSESARCRGVSHGTRTSAHLKEGGSNVGEDKTTLGWRWYMWLWK